MAQFIETKIRYDKVMENGAVKKVTELFLVDALSFTEAESRIIEEQAPYISGDFSVSAVKKSNIAEIFHSGNGDKWFKCKINYIVLNEKSGAEGKKASYILVRAYDLEDALASLKKGMKGTMADFEIAAISETEIMDVYFLKINS